MTIKNLPASVHGRLMNRARATNRPFQEILQYYAMERFLYRLSRSPHSARFVLKGALMLYVWDTTLARATKDVDFLGQLDNSLDNLARVVREVCVIEVEPDGMAFDAATVVAERIKEDADYEGVRIGFTGHLGKAKSTMQLDAGFGDVVTPASQAITYPTLLDFPAAQLAGYPRETVIAEKFQAMVYLGKLNSRMKDFDDIWLLARQFEFQGQTLATAVFATFSNRGTAIDSNPVALTSTFTESPTTRTQWTAFRQKGGLLSAPEKMTDMVAFLSGFLLPVARACEGSPSFQAHSRPPGPWSSEVT